MKTASSRHGFTLIELSIVLVIIGLIVGGILTGQTLIAAAGVRAQISQIEKFNTATATFKGKYGYLPGDMPAAPAAMFGFVSRGTSPGQGNGNGILEGYDNDGTNDAGYGVGESVGETVVFWVDLSTAHLIEGGFVTASETVVPSADITGTTLAAYFPAAKIGNNNYVYAYGGANWSGLWAPTGQNYFGLSNLSAVLAQSFYGAVNSTPGLTVQQAYSIDKKVDDGLPQTGTVTAVYLNNALDEHHVVWAQGGGVEGAAAGNAITGSSTTCYDNGGNAGTPASYSLGQSNGNGVNCALSFLMQVGD